MIFYPCAFKVAGGFTTSGISVTVGHGTVNGYEPRVNGQRISGMGDDGKISSAGPPVITGAMTFDVYGRTYVCIRVKIDPKTGKMKKPPTEDDLTIEISHKVRTACLKNQGLPEPIYWNHPIATFTDMKVFGQVAHFNLQHFTSKSQRFGSEIGVWFHYFSAA